MKILKTKSARFTTSAVLISSLFAACGGGGGGSPTAAPPPTQAPAATVVSTSPVDKARSVPARQEIVIRFSGPLNESTVTSSNVLVTGGGVTAPVSVTYDAAAYTITIRPQEPLSDGVQYTVAIPGVRDFSGNAIASPNFSYRTFITGSPRTVAYSAGAIVGYTDYILDSEQNIVRIVEFNNPGNATWFDADDQASTYQRLSYDANGNAYRVENWSTGADRRVGGTDDTLVSLQTKVFDANGKITQVVNYTAGADGIAFTRDDVVTSFTASTYNTSGYLTRIVNYSSAGADGIPGTADDVADTYTTREYNARNSLTREVTYTATAGRVTASDLPVTFSQRSYDAAGNMTQRINYTGPGADRAAFTGDDVIEYVSTVTYDANGNPIRNIFRSGTATTSPILGYLDFTFDTRGGLTLLQAYDGPGTDATFFNGNDSYRHYTKTVYDNATGNLISRTTYTGPGPNGTWDPTATAPDDQIGQAGNFFGL